MNKIPFTVSARTARLIGRENIASSKGAIVELVKNAYDADSRVCVVLFDNKYGAPAERYPESSLEELEKRGVARDLLAAAYTADDGDYVRRHNLANDIVGQLETSFRNTSTLYIIDNGDGMTDQIIRDHWMTIGTDNKSTDPFTNDGRVKAGAKGIGRFALDKLGDRAHMVTVFDKNRHSEGDAPSGAASGFDWRVRWSDFEGDARTIDQVHAELEGFCDVPLYDRIRDEIDCPQVLALLQEPSFQTGTLLKIEDLRETWGIEYVKQVFADLEVLVPPREDSFFQVYLFSSIAPEDFGPVKDSVCDDYDYKLQATADANGDIDITIHRREFNVDQIDPKLFERDAMKSFPYRRKDFRNGVWEMSTTLSKLAQGYGSVEDSVLGKIGPFDGTLYFLKKSYMKSDAKIYAYRHFHSHERKAWLDRFGGIKIFRDDFRVRPYGEADNPAFDWLGLGARKYRSPASVAKRDGGYKVAPDNISGIIRISRFGNPLFDDKSSREGLQEHPAFGAFQAVIKGMLDVLERDRSFIARQMAQFYKAKHQSEADREQASALAKRILERKQQREAGEETGDKEAPPATEVILAEQIHDQEEQIDCNCSGPIRSRPVSVRDAVVSG